MNQVDFENYKDTLPKPNISNSSVTTQNNLDADDIWKAVKEQIRVKIDDRNFNTWFNDAYIENISNGVVEFSCANDIQKDAIVRDYLQTLKESIEKTTGMNIMINFSSRNDGKEIKKKKNYEYYNAHRHRDEESSKDLFSDLEKERAVREKAIQKAQLNPKYTFDNFIVGLHNRLADAVARASVEELGAIYNPVFFYGNTGVGKTPLI